LVRITFSALCALSTIVAGIAAAWLTIAGLDYMGDASRQDAPIYSWAEAALRFAGALIAFSFSIGSAVCFVLSAQSIRRPSRNR